MTDFSYKNMFRLDGKVALVTGATGILGQEFCRAFLEMGAKVALLDLDRDKLSLLESSFVDLGYQSEVLSCACDITDLSAIKAAFQTVLSTFGHVDILHNNAATKGDDLTKFFTPTEEYPEETWQQVLDVNLTGAFNMAKIVGGYMVKKGQGSIINTASIYGMMGADQRIYDGAEYMGVAINNPAVYSASKAGLIGLTRHLAAQWGAQGVRVNAVTPGGVSSGQNGTFHQKYANRVPMGRMAYAHEICGAVVFLASDASSYINGQNIAVDGGLSCW